MNATAPPTRRNLWPWAIIGFFVLFIAWTVGFIIFSTTQRVDLVRPDYYAEELRYQERIDAQQRARQLHQPVQVTYTGARQALRIQLPATPAGPRPSGAIHLYRPAAAGLDQQLPLDVDALGQQTIDVSQLARGLWRVQVQWTAEGREYYHAQDVVIAGEASP